MPFDLPGVRGRSSFRCSRRRGARTMYQNNVAGFPVVSLKECHHAEAELGEGRVFSTTAVLMQNRAQTIDMNWVATTVHGFIRGPKDAADDFDLELIEMVDPNGQALLVYDSGWAWPFDEQKRHQGASPWVIGWRAKDFLRYARDRIRNWAHEPFDGDFIEASINACCLKIGVDPNEHLT